MICNFQLMLPNFFHSNPSIMCLKNLHFFNVFINCCSWAKYFSFEKFLRWKCFICFMEVKFPAAIGWAVVIYKFQSLYALWGFIWCDLPRTTCLVLWNLEHFRISFILWNFKISLASLGRLQKFQKTNKVNLSQISLINR